jgi:hypothetical protein
MIVMILKSFSNDLVSDDSLKSIIKNASPIKYKAVKINSKIFKIGYLLKKESLTQGIRSETCYILNQDTIFFSELFPLTIKNKLERFNYLLKLNKIKLQTAKDIQEYLIELCSFQSLALITDSIQYNEIKNKFMPLAKNMLLCDTHPVYQDSVLKTVDE